VAVAEAEAVVVLATVWTTWLMVWCGRQQCRAAAAARCRYYCPSWSQSLREVLELELVLMLAVVLTF
jgi:hypothetical protein